MTVGTITLRCFRNHRDTTIDMRHRSGILYGENGQGKTNILEALSYLCLTKSFFGALDTTVVTLGENAFTVLGTFRLDSGREITVDVAYAKPANEKTIRINTVALEKNSDLIGRLPLVVLSPEHAAITLGGPAERRRFIDLAISQSSSMYLGDIIEYRRILRQRNIVLSDARARRTTVAGTIEPWNESLLRTASRVILRRKKFLEQFSGRVVSSYRTLTGADEIPEIEYSPSRPGESADDIRTRLEEELDEKKQEELRLGTTLVGPHRDELRFTINGMELRKFASQGQHKTFLIALKMAEFRTLNEICGETPVMLLDDVFSELDSERAQRLLEQVNTLGQTFITTTEHSFIERWARTGRELTGVVVKNGTASHAEV